MGKISLILSQHITNTSKKYIKLWDPSKYHLAISEEYPEYIATDDNPAIIRVGNTLTIFPLDIDTGEPPEAPRYQRIKFHYIGVPLDPTTGEFLIQNGDYDSPFFDHWNKSIADIAYLMFLQETNQTA